jgi:hypothetical protein
VNNERLLTQQELEQRIYGVPHPCCGGWVGHKASCELFVEGSLLQRSMKALRDAADAREKKGE